MGSAEGRCELSNGLFNKEMVVVHVDERTLTMTLVESQPLPAIHEITGCDDCRMYTGHHTEDRSGGWCAWACRWAGWEALHGADGDMLAVPNWCPLRRAPLLVRLR